MYTAGIHLSLRGTTVTNNSYVDIDSIGTSDNDADALLCDTDSEDGDWYYHNDTVVKDVSAANNTSAFVSNRNEMVIKLFRTNTSTVGGQFYCMANDTNQILIYVTICEL